MAVDRQSSHAGRFFRSWLTDPLGVAAVMPSGKALARAMTSDIVPETGPVIEFGPGTGVFTNALLGRGVRESDLTLIEFREDFTELLRAKFPLARVLRMDAGHILRHRLFDGAPAGAVVSGLPILSMSPRKATYIMAGAFSHLRPGGAFIQFTYGPRCPVPDAILRRLGLRSSRVGRALLNVPPAAVYRITRAAEQAATPPSPGPARS